MKLAEDEEITEEVIRETLKELDEKEEDAMKKDSLGMD